MVGDGDNGYGGRTSAPQIFRHPALSLFRSATPSPPKTVYFSINLQQVADRQLEEDQRRAEQQDKELLEVGGSWDDVREGEGEEDEDAKSTPSKKRVRN